MRYNIHILNLINQTTIRRELNTYEKNYTNYINNTNNNNIYKKRQTNKL